MTVLILPFVRYNADGSLITVFQEDGSAVDFVQKLRLQVHSK